MHHYAYKYLSLFISSCGLRLLHFLAVRLAADVQGKYQDAQRALVGDSAKLAAVQQETWLLKANVESRLSSLLHGREVNIFGINIS